MDAWNSFWFVITRALQISVNLMGPVTVPLWALSMGGLAWLHWKRPRLASLLTLFVAVMAFFVIWNHPDFAWYKARPWQEGYAYSWSMVLVYVLAPVVVGRLLRRAWLWLRRRVEQREADQRRGPGGYMDG